VLRIIKSDLKTRNIPVVVMTSSNEQRDVIDCYTLGANSYIVKPIDFREYFKVIANIAQYWLAFNLPSPQPVWTHG
jgi:CheY-like chemotaxis protein